MEEKKYSDRIERLHVPTGASCNNKCVFCMEFPRDTGIVPDDAMVRRQIEANKSGGIVLFTAGEPTLNPDLEARVRAAREAGYHTICLITNGRLLADLDLCVRLLEAGLNDITISIHGHRAEIHDALTGVKGSFEQTWQAIQHFNDLIGDYRFKFSLSTVVTKLNLPHLYEMMGTFIAQNIDIATFKTPRIEGRALKNLDSVVPDLPEAALAAKDALEKLIAENPDLLTTAMISITGIPYCLMGGYEIFVGSDEIVLGLFTRDVETTRIENMADSLKRDACRDCACEPICYGVEKIYIERKGWDAFTPVREISEQFRRHIANPPGPRRVKIGLSDVLAEERPRLEAEIEKLKSEFDSGAEMSDSKRADIAFDIGLRRLMLAQPRQALRYLDEALKLEPGHGGAHLKKTLALAAMCKMNAAREALVPAEQYCKDDKSLAEIAALKKILATE